MQRNCGFSASADQVSRMRCSLSANGTLQAQLAPQLRCIEPWMVSVPQANQPLDTKESWAIRLQLPEFVVAGQSGFLRDVELAKPGIPFWLGGFSRSGIQSMGNFSIRMISRSRCLQSRRKANVKLMILSGCSMVSDNCTKSAAHTLIRWRRPPLWRLAGVSSRPAGSTEQDP